MLLTIKNIFGPDYERYDGVYKINIYLLRLLFILMFLFLGKDAWTHMGFLLSIVYHRDTTAPQDAAPGIARNLL